MIQTGKELRPQELITISGKEYPVIGIVETEETGTVPLVDVPMMSDLKWHKNCLKSRIENLERYRSIGEDVEAVVRRLRRDIAKMEAAGVEWEMQRV